MTNEKPGVILTLGISNSGKSTWAHYFCSNNPMYKEINRDDMRIAFFMGGDKMAYHRYKFSKVNEKVITDCVEIRAKRYLSNGNGIVISDTNLNAKTREYWSKFAEAHNVPFRIEVFDTPLHVCMSRNRKRDLTFPDHVLRRQYKSYREFKGLPTYEGTDSKPRAVVFDMDGTLSDMGGVRGPLDWDKVINDKPNSNVVELSNLLSAAGYKIIIMSGRDGQCLGDTEEWLQDHSVPYDAIFMRSEGDHRADAIVKEEMFWSCVADNFDVKYVVDDRNQMVQQWRAMGLECWQVADGDF